MPLKSGGSAKPSYQGYTNKYEKRCTNDVHDLIIILWPHPWGLTVPLWDPSPLGANWRTNDVQITALTRVPQIYINDIQMASPLGAKYTILVLFFKIGSGDYVAPAPF
jgi:hypothetical protein